MTGRNDVDKQGNGHADAAGAEVIEPVLYAAEARDGRGPFWPIVPATVAWAAWIAFLVMMLIRSHA